MTASDAEATATLEAAAAAMPEAHRRVVVDLLAWGRPRPTVDADLADRLVDRLEGGLAGHLADGADRLWLSKSGLRALECDGRWLDHRDQTFTPSIPLVRGQLVHRAAELDAATQRQRELAELLDHAWDELASQPNAQADLLNALSPIDVADLRATCIDRLVEWRLLWPQVDAVEVSFEHGLRANLADGRVVLSGRPDLVVRSPRPRAGRATDLLIDLKTGQRNEVADRADLRLYAVLWTLKYRRPPFRWATFYLAEGRWVAEDFREELLLGAVDRVVDGVERAVALAPLEDPDPTTLRLVPGRHCSYCGRRATCPEAPARVR